MQSSQIDNAGVGVGNELTLEIKRIACADNFKLKSQSNKDKRSLNVGK